MCLSGDNRHNGAILVGLSSKAIVHGFGVPDATYLFHERDIVEPTFFLKVMGDTAVIQFDTTVVNHNTVVSKQGKPFYLHFQEANTGYLSSYDFRLIQPGTFGFLLPIDREKRGTLRVWFEGYLYEETFPLD